MKKQFKWRIKAKYPGRGPVFYNSDKKQIFTSYNKMFIRAETQTRVNGPNTAMGRIYITVEWPTRDEQKWGWNLYRHESGHNAAHKIRYWCNYLLNNPPYGISEIKGKI